MSFFFLTWRGGGWYVRATFPHLGVTKHTSCCPVPLAPPLSLTPPPPFFPVCLCLCALCEPLSLLITIKVHPHPQVGKYNFLCALGNLYNSIWNLNETINVENLKRDNIGEIRKKQEMHVSLFVFFLWFQLFLLVFSGGCVTAGQSFCCVFTQRHKTPTKAFRSIRVHRYDAMQCAVTRQ